MQLKLVPSVSPAQPQPAALLGKRITDKWSADECIAFLFKQSCKMSLRYLASLEKENLEHGFISEKAARNAVAAYVCTARFMLKVLQENPIGQIAAKL